jgi:hypothetical protein
MTGGAKWFSNLNTVHGKQYITFKDNNKGKVVSHGAVKVDESFVLKDVALVANLHFSLLSVLQFLEDSFKLRFTKGVSRLLDFRGDLVCQISSFGCVFHDDFSRSFGPSHCLVAGLLLIFGSGIRG